MGWPSGGGTIRNNTGRFLIFAHEKSNEINAFAAPSGPTIIVIYQWVTKRFAQIDSRR